MVLAGDQDSVSTLAERAPDGHESSRKAELDRVGENINNRAIKRHLIPHHDGVPRTGVDLELDGTSLGKHAQLLAYPGDQPADRHLDKVGLAHSTLDPANCHHVLDQAAQTKRVATDHLEHPALLRAQLAGLLLLQDLHIAAD